MTDIVKKYENELSIMDRISRDIHIASEHKKNSFVILYKETSFARIWLLKTHWYIAWYENNTIEEVETFSEGAELIEARLREALNNGYFD